MEVATVSAFVLQGFRERGRGPVGFVAATFSISSESCNSSTATESPVSSRDVDEVCAMEPGPDLSTNALRDCEGFQLKLPDRLLLADEGLEAGGVQVSLLGD